MDAKLSRNCQVNRSWKTRLLGGCARRMYRRVLRFQNSFLTGWRRYSTTACKILVTNHVQAMTFYRPFCDPTTEYGLWPSPAEERATVVSSVDRTCRSNRSSHLKQFSWLLPWPRSAINEGIIVVLLLYCSTLQDLAAVHLRYLRRKRRVAVVVSRPSDVSRSGEGGVWRQERDLTEFYLEFESTWI